MTKTSVIRLAAIVVTASIVLAQSRPKVQARDSAPEKLNYFAGTWTIEVQMKANALGSRAFFATEHNEWMPGRSLLVSRQEGDTVLGGSGFAVMAYDCDEKVYAYHIVKSTGETEVLKGKLEGNTWIWTSEGTAKADEGGKARLIVTELSPTSYTLKFEAASNEHGWSTILEGKATKVIPHTHQDVAFLR
jgi:hypothetical protein